MKRWIGFATGIIIIGSLAWVFLFLKDWHPSGALGVRLGDGRSRDFAIRFKDTRLVGWANGKRIWMLDAGDINISRDRRLATFTGIAKGTLLMDGKPAANLYAGKVFYNMSTGNVMVPDGARLSVRGGPTLWVKNVLWDNEKSSLLCKQGVSGRLAGGKFYAERAEADIAGKEIRASKVTGNITLSGDTMGGLLPVPGGR